MIATQTVNYMCYFVFSKSKGVPTVLHILHIKTFIKHSNCRQLWTFFIMIPTCTLWMRSLSVMYYSIANFFIHLMIPRTFCHRIMKQVPHEHIFDLLTLWRMLSNTYYSKNDGFEIHISICIPNCDLKEGIWYAFW